MPGYLYILKNDHIPNLVKIGFTERDPQTRAVELSGHTGVPGKFKIVFSWFVADASDIEKRVHLELAAYRRTGEFFELTTERAKSSVAAALRQWGAIGADGLSFEGRKVQEQEQARAEQRREVEQHKQDVSDFEMSMRSIVDDLEGRERREGATAHAATEKKGVFAIFKSSDTLERKNEIRKAIEFARNSLAGDLVFPWLVTPPSRVMVLDEDVFFVIGDGKAQRTTAELYAEYMQQFEKDNFLYVYSNGGSRRLPKGTTIKDARGWKFDGRQLINTGTGEVLDGAEVFSEKRPVSYGLMSPGGRHFSEELNLGAYHCKTLHVFVGEIPLAVQ